MPIRHLPRVGQFLINQNDIKSDRSLPALDIGYVYHPVKLGVSCTSGKKKRCVDINIRLPVDQTNKENIHCSGYVVDPNVKGQNDIRTYDIFILFVFFFVARYQFPRQDKPIPAMFRERQSLGRLELLLRFSGVLGALVHLFGDSGL